MEIRRKLNFLYIGFFLVCLIYGCQRKPNSNMQDYELPEPIYWRDVKESLLAEELRDEDLINLKVAIYYSQFNFHQSDLPDIINAIRVSGSSDFRLLLMKEVRHFLSEEDDLKSLFIEIAASNDKDLAPMAFSELVFSELSIDEYGQDQWDTWAWPHYINSLFEEAVNHKMYMLSSLGPFDSGIDSVILLRLFDRYPDSKLTEGAIFYRTKTGGEPYVGRYSSLPDDEVPPVLRTPLNLTSELDIWLEFLEKYPGHPASDDAKYRIARIHELNGNYIDAFTSYYKVHKMPDGVLGDVALARALFIADLLLDSKSLSELKENIEHSELVPFLEYAIGVHLIREGELESALSKLEKFYNEYQDGDSLQGFIDPFLINETGLKIPSYSNFWSNVSRQVKNLKHLIKIRQAPKTDESLYEEAAFWFHNELTAYNYFWRGQKSSTFNGFIPTAWQGEKTSTKLLLRHEMLKDVGNNYDAQNGHLISIEKCRSLLEKYPESKLLEKAKYTIILNYYWLNLRDAGVSLETARQWDDVRDKEKYGSGHFWNRAAIETAHKFVEVFPNSTKADDALLVIGELESAPRDVKALERLLNDYPRSDRKRSAKNLLAQRKLSLANSRREDGIIAIGIQLGQRRGGFLNLRQKVFIEDIVPGSSASLSDLRIGDRILEVDGRVVNDSVDVQAYVRSHEPGERVALRISRNNLTIDTYATAELVPF